MSRQCDWTKLPKTSGLIPGVNTVRQPLPTQSQSRAGLCIKIAYHKTCFTITNEAFYLKHDLETYYISVRTTGVFQLLSIIA